jgi:hypothetical protein
MSVARNFGRESTGMWLRVVGVFVTLVCGCCCGVVSGVVGSAVAAGLPDGRVVEIVTPAQNDDASVYTPEAMSEELYPGEGDTTTRLPFRASTNGDAVAYVGGSTVGGMGDTGASEGNEYVATRAAAGGWSQVNVEPLGINNEGVNDLTGQKSTYYQAFSSDLSVGILQSGEEKEPVLSAEAPANYHVLYTHMVSQAGSVPLFTVTPPDRSEKEFESSGVPKIYPGAGGVLVFAGASAGLSQATAGSSELLFEANDALTTNAVDGGPGANNLYVSVGGRLSLVNVLPDGVAAPSATFGSPALQEPGENSPDFSDAVSGDGSRVFWTDLASHDLFMRLNPTRPQSPMGTGGECTVTVDACTVEVDAAAPGASGSNGGGQFWTADSNGSLVFFTDESRLTVGSTATAGAPDLYEYEVPTGRLADLTVDGKEPADVQAVIGASNDGSRVYFAARSVLASNENSEHRTAQAGQPNVYLFEEGKKTPITFIATLSRIGDPNHVIPKLNNVPPYAEVGDLQPGIGNRTAEVSSSGSTLVFMSNNQSVGGYTPEFNGKSLEEVYVYEAEDAGEGGELFCASCAASRKQPELANFLTEEGLGAFLPPDWSLTQQPQWMSEDGGRVFFDSVEPLVPADTNGKPDVYEWERNGVGSCAEASGCIYLLSGGASAAASWLIGVSASGNDVFMVSRAQLVPQDKNETYSVFDARVDGVPPATPPSCVESSCQGVPAGVPAFATPPTVTFEGVGNFPPPTASTKTKTKASTKARAKKKARPKRKVKGKAKRSGAKKSVERKVVVGVGGGVGR